MEKGWNFIRKNYGWIVALTTGMSVIFSFVLRFIRYIQSTLYFDYYGISYGLFKIDEINIVYDLCFSILFGLCFYSVCYCYIKIYNYIKSKERKWSLYFIDILIIIVSNSYIICSFQLTVSLLYYILNLLLLIVIEIVVTLVFCFIAKKDEKKYFDNNELMREFVDILRIFPLYLFMMILFISFSYVSSLQSIDKYRIVDNDKVIVYSTNEYFVLLDCKVDDNSLVIYRGTQIKVDNTNLESVLTIFEKVKIE